MQFRVPDAYILCIISYLFFSYNDNDSNNSSLMRFGFGFRFIAENFREEKNPNFLLRLDNTETNINDGDKSRPTTVT